MSCSHQKDPRSCIKVVGHVGTRGMGSLDQESSQLALHTDHGELFDLEVDEETGKALRSLDRVVAVEGRLSTRTAGRRVIEVDRLYIIE